MKRKDPMIGNATKKDLKVLEDSLRGDMKVLEDSLRGDMKVLEKSLRKDMEILENSLRAEIKLNTDEILVKVDKNARGYRDEILTKMDEIMGELQTIREDNIIGTHQISNLQEASDNHEKRIKRLEKIQFNP